MKVDKRKKNNCPGCKRPCYGTWCRACRPPQFTSNAKKMQARQERRLNRPRVPVVKTSQDEPTWWTVADRRGFTQTATERTK